MNFDFETSRIDFVKHRKKFFIFSGSFLLIGIILLATLGLNLGIDFRAGTTIDVLAEDNISAAEINSQFEEIGYTPDEITIVGDASDTGRVQFIGDLNQQQTLEIQNYFEELYGSTPNVSTVTPIVGEELARNAIISVLIAAVGIIIYVTIRFEFLYALAAVAALAHDALFILIFFSMTQLEVNVPFIAAVLTIVGYSINDTIVTFDRIRENLALEKKVSKFKDLADVVNKSLIQTLARSINTVLTVVFAAAALVVFGGEGLRVFSIALVVGLLAGTYSSLFIASQLWLEMKNRQVKKREQKKLEEQEQPSEA
ncbi:protein translocase subunit SecF [Paenalkalicoccus suaedae]|uniref:Protein-export membrane protein SecF n=1 Tax=Paenalkalicoccus suaedae TaxID=2592382 RepID=A0A859FD62_9BACI|nr:protein translocase subunit SecF [Paenalkalicoccus suaedae]QKS70778.1 protein translocase subunit SecF [Paenalkalicoccus suaedae]